MSFIVAFIIGVITLCLIGTLLPVQGKKIAVLGMKGAGKTMFNCFLQNKPYSELVTVDNKYESFDYVKSDGTKIHIRGGWDYGGSKDVAIASNEKLIAESDTIFFLFDFSEYIKNEDYKEETNSRLRFITTSVGDKELYVFGTHIDIVENYKLLNRSIEEFKTYLEKNGFTCKIKQGNLALLDMTNKEELKQVIDKLFK